MQPEEGGRSQEDRLRDVSSLAERLGCTVTQLVIAWCLKNDSVQCLLFGASSVEQLYENIQSLQVTKNCFSYNIFKLRSETARLNQKVLIFFFNCAFYEKRAFSSKVNIFSI